MARLLNVPVSMTCMSSALSISQQIDAIIKEPGGWRSAALSQLRAAIKRADPAAVEEVKGKKPARPMGVPVWVHDGNVCIAEPLKNAVRLTFPKGALVKDPKRLFNARLDSSSVRAIDFHEGDTVDETALKALIVQAVAVNRSSGRDNVVSRTGGLAPRAVRKGTPTAALPRRPSSAPGPGRQRA